jgi:hypothetical protein
MRLIVCEISLKRHGRVVNRQKAAVHRRRQNGAGRSAAVLETDGDRMGQGVAQRRCTGGDRTGRIYTFGQVKSGGGVYYI